MATIIGVGGHRSGYFSHPSEQWSITDFVDHVLQTDPGKSDRNIYGIWLATLRRVERCRTRRRCCSPSDRHRAATLRGMFQSPGTGSDQNLAREHLRAHRSRAGIASTSINNTWNIGAIASRDVNTHTLEVIPASTHKPTASDLPGHHVDHGQTGEDYRGHQHSQSSVASEDTPTYTIYASSPQPSDVSSGLPDEYALTDSRRRVKSLDGFMDSYAQFKNEHKWRLPSGKFVEDVLYDAYLARRHAPAVEAMILNWTVDLGCQKTKSLFSRDDWETIVSQCPSLPPADERLGKFLLPYFKVKDVSALRDHCDTARYKPDCVKYNRDEHFNLEWAQRAIHQFLMLYESDEQFLGATIPESWYAINVWGHIIDNCFLSLPRARFERKEVACRSSAMRRNIRRKDTSSRLRPAPRVDGIVRSIADDTHEFCALEMAPRQSAGSSATKWLKDKAKLTKLLRDMLNRLITVSDNDSRVVPQLQVVGLSIAGLSFQMSRLCYGKGYISLFSSEPVVSAPSAVGQLKDLLKLLILVERIKRVVATTISAFRSRTQDDETVDAESQLRELLGTKPNVTLTSAPEKRTPPMPQAPFSP